MKEGPIETAAAAASAALKVTVAGGATAAAGEWWVSSEALAVVGVVIAAIGLCAQIWYLRAGHRLKLKAFQMDRAEHIARMKTQYPGEPTATTGPGAL